MSGGQQQQHPSQFVPAPSGPRQDPLASLTGSSPMGGGQGKQMTPDDIKQMLSSAVNGTMQGMGRSAASQPFNAPPPQAPSGSPAMTAAVSNMTTNGLGAGDAAAQAAMAAGASLPGNASGQAVANMQQGMAEQQRAKIQAIMQAAQMMAGGG